MAHRFLCGSGFLGIVATVCGACGDVRPPPSFSPLVEESGSSLDAVPRVARLRVSGVEGIVAEDVWVVEGEVTSVSEGRLRRGDVPQTVQDSRVPAAVWAEGDEFIVAPSVVLGDEQTYTISAIGFGNLGRFSVVDDERPVLALWTEPPVHVGQEVVYCAGAPPRVEGGAGEGAAPATDGTTTLAGLGAEGLAADRCIRYVVQSSERDFVVPPTSAGDWLIEPRPLPLVELPAELSSGGEVPEEIQGDQAIRDPCSRDSQLGFSGGCAELVPGALALHLEAGSYYFELLDTDDRQQLLVQVSEPETHHLGPLGPRQSYTLTSLRFASADSSTPDPSTTHSFTAGRPAPRFVLTEALADPFGAEPESEWVEIVNVGSGAGPLADLQLWDSGGGVTLPDVDLGVGEVGLIVTPHFAFESDVVPAPDSVPIVVESLGENGLRNSGEEVQLRSPSGQVLSAIPAHSSAAGKSVARVSAWAADSATSFFVSDPPTPGVFPPTHGSAD